MAIDQTSNLAQAELAALYAAGITDIDVATGEGSEFNADVNAFWWNSTDYPSPPEDPDVEIVRITNVAVDTLTVTRGQEGTADSAKNIAGKTYKIAIGITKKTIDDIRTDIGTNTTAIGLNTTHRTSAGTDHSDVGLNNTHRGSDGKNHSDVVTNNAKVSFNTDQNAQLSTTGSPDFAGLSIPATSTETKVIELGTGRAGDGASIIDMISDAVYVDYGFRVVRFAGENAISAFYHRGTGSLEFRTREAAPITFLTDDSEEMRVQSSGNVCIGNTNDTYALDVTGEIRATDTMRANNAIVIGQLTSGVAEEGMLLYNTSLKKLQMYNGTTWETVTSV